MELTWGFLAFMVVFLIPGFIIRRLYFHSDFSKQFRYNEPILKTLFYSLIPGIINAIVAFYLFDRIFMEIDLGQVVDNYKSLSQADSKFTEQDGTPLKITFTEGVVPFVGFSILLSLIAGYLAGRTVRVFGLDKRWSVLKYRNHWYYLFADDNANVGRYKIHKERKAKQIEKNARHLFTIVDVMVDTSDKRKLYSGILIDYELDPEHGMELHTLVLKDAKKYTYNVDKASMEAIAIPGDIFVVHCSGLNNLNLTHVYGKSPNWLTTKFPKYYSWFILSVSLLSLPLFFFPIESIQNTYYQGYFHMTIIGRVFMYFSINLLFNMMMIYVRDKKSGSYRLVKRKVFVSNVVFFALTYYIALKIEQLAQWILS